MPARRGAGQLAKVHDRVLADLSSRIAAGLRQTPVVVLLYRPVFPLPVFRYLADEHAGKGTDFWADCQTPGGPTGGGKSDGLLNLFEIFSGC